MIYDWRVYQIVPGKARQLNERFANHTMALFRKHGMEIVGFWENSIGGTTNTLYYMLGFKDAAQRESAWKSFKADSKWQKVAQESEKDGPLVVRERNMTLTPTYYSPMK